jgi:hypothetical protein
VFTVIGARWRKKDNLASPFPETEARHSTFETEPAAGAGEDNGRGPQHHHYSVFAKHEKKTYEATSAGEPNSEVF